VIDPNGSALQDHSKLVNDKVLSLMSYITSLNLRLLNKIKQVIRRSLKFDMNISRRNGRKRLGFYLKSERVWWRMKKKGWLSLILTITSTDQSIDSIHSNHKQSLKYSTERRKHSKHSKRKVRKRWNRSLHRRKQPKRENWRTCPSWRKSSSKHRNERSS